MSLNTKENVAKVKALQDLQKEISWDFAVKTGAADALSEKLRSVASPQERYDALKDFHHTAFGAGCVSAMVSVLAVKKQEPKPDNMRAAGLDAEYNTQGAEMPGHDRY